MTHSSGSTLLCGHEITHTHKKKQHFRNFKHTREKDDNSNNDPFEKKQLYKIAHDVVSLYLPPVSVPNQKQPNPKRTSISKEKNTIGTKTIRKTSENTKQIAITEANNRTPPKHHLQLTSTRHNTDVVNKLIRFVVSFGDLVHRRRTCRCHTERKIA